MFMFMLSLQALPRQICSVVRPTSDLSRQILTAQKEHGQERQRVKLMTHTLTYRSYNDMDGCHGLLGQSRILIIGEMEHIHILTSRQGGAYTYNASTRISPHN